MVSICFGSQQVSGGRMLYVKVFCWGLIWKEGPEVWEQKVKRAFKQEENSLSWLLGMLARPC